VGYSKPQDISHEKATSKLASRLASLQIDQKPPTDTSRQRKFILTHIQRLSPASDRRSECEHHRRSSTFNCVFAHTDPCSRAGIFHCKSLEVKKMCPDGNTPRAIGTGIADEMRRGGGAVMGLALWVERQ